MTAVQAVAFVCEDTRSASARYRVLVPAAGLQARSIPVLALSPDDDSLAEALTNVSHAILFRIQATKRLLGAITQARKANPRLVVSFDVDDPIFTHASHIGGMEAAARTLHLMRHCDGFTATTKAIALQGSKLAGVPGDTFPNGILPLQERIARRARRFPRRPGGLRLGFLSGSATHDGHWQLIAAAVARHLRRNPHSSLWVFGSVSLGPELAGLSDRVVRVPYLDWTDLPYWIRQLDLVLAPNADDELLADTKSHLKWLEAALVETPTLATPTQPFVEAITPNQTGFLAPDRSDDWDEALTLAADRKTATQVGRNARSSAQKRFCASEVTDRLLQALLAFEPRGLVSITDDIELPEQSTMTTCTELTAARTKPRLPWRLIARYLLR